MAVLVQHTFTAANNSTGLPNADTGQTTQVLAGTWGVESNRAYWVSGNPALSVWESGQSDVQISLDNIFTTNNDLSGAIAFRVSDSSNYWLFRYLGGSLQLYKFVGGTATQISSVAYSSLIAGTHVFKVIANGTSIQCYVDNTLQISITDTHNQTATKHGLRNHTATTTRFDNFLIESLTTPTYTDGSTTFDTKQSIYQDNSTLFNTKQTIYSDSFISYDTKQAIYSDSSVSFDTIQQIQAGGVDGSVSFDTKQTLYSDSSVSFDTKQGLYSDSQVLFNTKQAYYNDGFVSFDTLQVIEKIDWVDGSISFDTQQLITETPKVVAQEVNLTFIAENEVNLSSEMENSVSLSFTI